MLFSLLIVFLISWQNGNLPAISEPTDQEIRISESVATETERSLEPADRPVSTHSSELSATSSAQVLGSQAGPTTHLVTKVRDGDTIEVEYEGQIKAVRLVGINTPETVDPRKPVECFGASASARLKQLLMGQAVTLESDKTQQDADRYGRLLRFVFLNGADVGLQMITEGLAEESLYSAIPHKYRETYLTAEQQAQLAKAGLWADGVCQ